MILEDPSTTTTTNKSSTILRSPSTRWLRRGRRPVVGRMALVIPVGLAVLVAVVPVLFPILLLPHHEEDRRHLELERLTSLEVLPHQNQNNNNNNNNLTNPSNSQNHSTTPDTRNHTTTTDATQETHTTKEKLSYETQFDLSTQLDPTQPVLAYAPTRFYSGFCNEVMVFTAFLMYAMDHNFTQVLLTSLHWKDLFGTNQRIAHEDLFDVVHWNQHYATFNTNNSKPPLPRLVVHHPSLIHMRSNSQWLVNSDNATLPYGYGKQTKLFVAYKQYTKGIHSQPPEHGRHTADLALMQGAFRPHPDLQQLIHSIQTRMLETPPPLSSSNSSSSLAADSPPPTGYMCLHARIEPDMQHHRPCKSQKETRLANIVQGLYQTFPEPPVQHVLIILNRPLLERENFTANPLALENLHMLNQVRRDGLWNGTVRVQEAGTGSLPKTSWYGKHAPSVAGSLVNYQLALQSDIFVGAPISSYAMHLFATRYHARQNATNYLYLPNQVVQRIDPTLEPPRFAC